MTGITRPQFLLLPQILEDIKHKEIPEPIKAAHSPRTKVINYTGMCHPEDLKAEIAWETENWTALSLN